MCVELTLQLLIIVVYFILIVVEGGRKPHPGTMEPSPEGTTNLCSCEFPLVLWGSGSLSCGSE